MSCVAYGMRRGRSGENIGNQQKDSKIRNAWQVISNRTSSVQARHPGTPLCILIAFSCVCSHFSIFVPIFCSCNTSIDYWYTAFTMLPYPSASHSRRCNTVLYHVSRKSPLLAAKALSLRVSLSKLSPSLLDSEWSFLCIIASGDTFFPPLWLLNHSFLSLLPCEVLCENFLYTILETHLFFLIGTLLSSDS